MDKLENPVKDLIDSLTSKSVALELRVVTDYLQVKIENAIRLIRSQRIMAGNL